MTFRIVSLILSSAVAFAMTLSLAAYATEVPIRKPGQWRLTTVSDAAGMTTIETCIASTDNVVTGENAENCGPVEVRVVANETFVNVICKAGSTQQKISSLLTGDFDTWYRAVTKITFDPPEVGVSHLGVIVDGKYLGPACKTENSEAATAPD